jgi:hypothetical protein
MRATQIESETKGKKMLAAAMRAIWRKGIEEDFREREFEIKLKIDNPQK